MNKTIGIFEAKTRFSELCEQVAKTGKEIVVTRRGKNVVRILPAVADAGQDPVAAAGVLDRLRENETLYGKASRMKQDFPDVWQTRVSKADSPLDGE
jgi:prevent-host-death family protein